MYKKGNLFWKSYLKVALMSTRYIRLPNCFCWYYGRENWCRKVFVLHYCLPDCLYV